jgi:hypothetical protein
MFLLADTPFTKSFFGVKSTEPVLTQGISHMSDVGLIAFDSRYSQGFNKFDTPFVPAWGMKLVYARKQKLPP